MICPSCGTPNEGSHTLCSSCGHSLGLATTLPEGFLVDGRYQLLTCLGQGGMGTVYQAHDRTLDERVALKVLRSDFADDEDMARRFRSEIKLARRIRHPNVCAIHEYGETGHLRYIAMELIEGIDLKRRLMEAGALPAVEAFEVAIQMAHGLEAIHRTGIVHRDLKSANVMLDRFGQVRLMDFGIAKQLGSETSLLATGIGKIIGTPEYMSPEQARGEKIDTRSDLYALGIVIYEIFTGHVPFHGDTPIATLFKNIEEPPALEGPLAEGIPASLKPVLTRLLAKAPAERFSTALEVADALNAVRQAPTAEPVPAPPPPTAPVAVTRSDTQQAVTIATPPPTRQPAPTLPSAPPVAPPTPPARPAAVGPPPTAALPSATPQPRPTPTRVKGSPAAVAHAPRQTAAVLVAAVLLVVAAAAIVTAVLVFRNVTGSRSASNLSTFTSTVPVAPPPSTQATPAPATLPPPTAIATATPPPATVSVVPTATPPPIRPVATPTVEPSSRPTVAIPTPRPTATATPLPTPRPIPTVIPTPAPKPTASPPPLTASLHGSPSAPTPRATPTPTVVEGGTLQLHVKPWALVRIDGIVMGTTPLKPIPLPPGEHMVELVHPAFKTLIRRIKIRPGVTTPIELDLNQDAVKKPPGTTGNGGSG